MLDRTNVQEEVQLDSVVSGMVEINEKNFPDKNFRNAITEFDINEDVFLMMMK